MGNRSWNKRFLELVSAKPIAFNRALAAISNSATAGLFMSQLLYWWDKGRSKEWIYKTIEEVWEETALTRSEQNTAIKKWSGLGVLQKKLRGVPPKRHFHIDTNKLAQLLKGADQFAENGKSSCKIEPNTTESTAESTSKKSRSTNGRVGNALEKDSPRISESKAKIRKILGIGEGPP